MYVVHGRLSGVLARLGHPEDADLHSRESGTFLELLLETTDNPKPFLVERVNFECRRAQLCSQRGDELSAIGHLEHALAVAQRELERAPEIATRLRLVCVVRSALAEALRASGIDLDRALELQAANRIAYEAAVAVSPTNAQARHDLAAHHGQIANLFVTRGDPASALAAQERRLGVARAMLEHDPSNVQAQRAVAQSLLGMGGLERDLGRLIEAGAHLTEARELLEGLVERAPTNPELLRDRWICYRMLGNAYAARGHGRGARPRRAPPPLGQGPRVARARARVLRELRGGGTGDAGRRGRGREAPRRPGAGGAATARARVAPLNSARARRAATCARRASHARRSASRPRARAPSRRS